MILMATLMAALGGSLGAFVGAIITEWAPRKGAWQIACGAAVVAHIGCYLLTAKTEQDFGVPPFVFWAGIGLGFVAKLVHFWRNRPQPAPVATSAP